MGSHHNTATISEQFAARMGTTAQAVWGGGHGGGRREGRRTCTPGSAVRSTGYEPGAYPKSVRNQIRICIYTIFFTDKNLLTLREFMHASDRHGQSDC